MLKKSVRYLNGYVLIYFPDHAKAMKSKNWYGYIYEHIVIAEKDLCRPLMDDEEVHHLDFNKNNNSPSNLIVLPKKCHARLHKWIENGMFIGVNKKNTRCKVCNNPLKSEQINYCSNICKLSNKKSKMDGVDLYEVLLKLSSNSMASVSREYGISDNGLKKWLRNKHNIYDYKLFI